MCDRRASTAAWSIGMLVVSLVAGCTSAARGTATPGTGSASVATSGSLAVTTSTVTVSVTTSTVAAVSTTTPEPATTPRPPAATAAPATPPPATSPPATMAPGTVPPTAAPASGPRMVFVALTSHPAGGACTQVGEVVVLVFTWQSAAAEHVRVTRPDGETLISVAPPASNATIPHICTAMPSLFRFYPVAADGTEGPPWNFNV